MQNLTLLNIEKNVDKIIETIESLQIEMFGVKDLKTIAVSLGILVNDLSLAISLVDVGSSDNIEIQNRGKRIIGNLIHWLGNSSVKTFGPREIILQHFMVQLFTGVLLLDSKRIMELIDLVPLATAFKILLSITRKDSKLEISKILSELLLRDFGISSLMQVLPKDSGSVKMLSNLVNSVPKNLKKEDYYRNITNQIFLLLSEREVDVAKANIGAQIIIEIIENSQKDDLKEYLMNSILYPFMLISNSGNNLEIKELEDTDLDGNAMFVLEEDLEKSLIQIQLIQDNLKGKQKMAQEVVKGFRGLYYLYQYAFDSKSGIKNILEELVSNFLQVEEARKECLRSLSFKPVLKCFVNIVHGSSGGLALSKGVEKVIELDIGVFMHVLKNIQEKTVISQLMLELLEFNFCLRDVEESLDPNERIIIFNLILAIMDEYGFEIIQNFSQLLSLIKSIVVSEDGEVVSLGLTLLVAVLGNDEIELSVENRAELKELTAILDEFKKNEEISDLAEEVGRLIISKSKNSDSGSQYGKKGPEDGSKAKFQEAIRSLADPLLPIRAFGLNSLRSLVLSGDPIVTERLDLILNIFLEQLTDEDSFIYLNSVKGLSALTDNFPVQSLKIIVARYKDGQNYTLDYRLRIGETLMQTIQRSGKSFAKYGSPILESILKVLHDEKKEMRASAMSCLAMISQEAPLTLLPIIYQVMQYFTNLLAFEDTVETRRAAVLNFACLIKGMDESFFTNLPSDIISSLQRQLEYIEATDQDPLTKSHARDAISHVYMLAPFLPK